jgi:hypothetical protein
VIVKEDKVVSPFVFMDVACRLCFSCFLPISLCSDRHFGILVAPIGVKARRGRLIPVSYNHDELSPPESQLEDAANYQQPHKCAFRRTTERSGPPLSPGEMSSKDEDDGDDVGIDVDIDLQDTTTVLTRILRLRLCLH